MKIKLIINTPKGQASGTNKKIKPFIIGKKKVKHSTFVNEEDSQILWEIDGDIKTILKIQRNVNMFASFISNLLGNKMVHGAIGKLSKEDQKTLTEMLENQTSVEIIKRATAEEIVEADKTWWDKLKEKFKEKKE